MFCKDNKKMVCRIGLELRSSRADASTFLSEVSSVFMGYIFVTRKRVIEYVRGCVGVLFVHGLHFCNPK